ncbi:lipoxygenase family protein [Archangium violaceum]|uniref:lipoxygenase family protein n=1 Tax=Archangium violaceum TaxID=83451 RepID=UPI0037BFD2B3
MATAASVQPLNPNASEYQYNYTYVKPLAMVQTLPKDQKPSFTWYLKVIWQVLQIARNRLEWKWQQAQREQGSSSSVPAPASALTLDLGKLGLGQVDLSRLPKDSNLDALNLESIEENGSPWERAEGEILKGLGVLGDMGEFLAHSERIARGVAQRNVTNPVEILKLVVDAVLAKPTGRPNSLQDYLNLFTSQSLPWAAGSFQEDATFAWMRVAGFNPLVIQKLTTLEPDLAITDAQFQRILGDSGDSVQRALVEGRLYVADYRELAGVINGNFPDGPKYCFAPKALFALPRGTGARQLKPVAIRCGQDPRAYPLFTPEDGEAWQWAKTTVQVADFNHHEMFSHLGRTHLLIEPFVIATHRQLPDGHPVGQLLLPHFEGTLSINDSAQSTLIAPGHQVDMLLGGTIQADRTLTVQSLLGSDYDFNRGMLPKQLELRGVTDAGLEYPYRDDALQVWGAIERWVRAYVGIHYASDEAVTQDQALQQWSAELVAEDGGRVRGFGEDGQGKLSTVEYLSQALTMILFTSSAQHAAVNFAQAGLMTFTPLAPGAAYRAAPLSVADAALNPSLDQYPPLDMAAEQLDFLSLLGGVYYSRLGQYRPFWFKGLNVMAALHTFKEELKQIGQEIEQRNANRYGPYPYLIPTNIPQSINI